MPLHNRTQTPIVPAALVGLGSLVLYALTASPYVGAEDIAEFQTLAASPGIAHAGYPLLTAALEAAHRLPFGTTAYRANLVSAFSAALAVALAVWSMTRYTGSRWAAVVTGGALALSYSLWHDATRAEIYAFTLPLAAGAFLALLAYHEHRRRRALFGCFLLVGLGLTSHLSSLSIACTAMVYALFRLARRELPLADVGVAVLGLLCGLLPFTFTLLRDVPSLPMNYIELTFDPWSGQHVPWAPDAGTRIQRFVALVSGRQYLETAWFQPFEYVVLRSRLLALNLVLNDLPGLGGLVALGGAAIAARRRAAGDLLLGTWLAATFFWLCFGAYTMVLASFFLPGLWVLAHFVALALAGTRQRRVLFGVLSASLLGFAALRPVLANPPPGLAGRPLVESVWNQFPNEWSPFAHDDSWEAYGRGVLGEVDPRSSILYCWEEGMVLMYFRHAEGLRADVELRAACASEPRLAAAIDQAHRDHRAVYTTIPPASMSRRRDWVEVRRWSRGGLWRLRVAPAADAGQRPVTTTLRPTDPPPAAQRAR